MNPSLRYRLLLGFLKGLARLPFGILYGISDIAYVLLYRVLGYRKNVVRTNLRAALPTRSDKELHQIERQFYHHLADIAVEAVKLLHISDSQMAAHVEFHNMEHLNAAAEDGRPIFVMLGHYGNWEWVPSITMSSSKRLTAGQIYRRQHDGVIDNAMLTLRSRFGSVSIPQDKAFRNILRRTNAGEQLLIGFIADQRPNSANLNHWTEFLHQDTAYAPGCEEIGQRVNAHYYYLDIEKTRRGHYSMTLCPIIPDSDLVGEKYPYTLQFMRMFQRTIERQPAYWLWSHKRWSIKRQQPEN